MKAGLVPAFFGWGGLLVASLALVLLQLLSSLNPATVELDPEEMYNAGQAWMMADGHWAAAFRLQYRDFCGGCTADATLGALLFSVLPRSWLVWKLVPLAYTALLAVVGGRLLWRRVGVVGAAALLLLLALPPRAWLHLSLIAWGNHVEAGVIGLLGFVLATAPAQEGRSRAGVGGILLGLSVWISFSGAFALIAAPVWLLMNRRWGRAIAVLAAAPIGLLGWLLQMWSTGRHPFVTIYEEGESIPSLARVPAKLVTLVAPGQIAALFGAPGTLGLVLGCAFVLGLMGVAAYALRRGRTEDRGLLLLLASWLGVYLCVRFQIWDPPWPEVAPPGSVRYAAPIYPVVFVLCASVIGQMWAGGRRGLAGLILALLLPSGLWARGLEAQAGELVPMLARREAVDWEHFRPQAAYALSLGEHEAPAVESPRSRDLHAYGAGWQRGMALLQNPDRPPFRIDAPAGAPVGPFAEGAADALLMDRRGRHDPGLATLEAVGRALRGPAATEQARGRAMRQAAWRLVQEQEGTWLPLEGSLDGAAAQGLAQRLAPLPPALQDAAAHAAGRAWAAAVTGPGRPRQLNFPEVELPTAFWEGLGFGLGEAWGPVERLPSPGKSADSPALLRGLAEGVASCWLGPWPAAQLSGADGSDPAPP